MNIASFASTAQINTAGPEGSTARADYHVAVAKKLNDQVKQEGEAAVKLIEEAAPASSDGVKGTQLSSYA